MLSKPVANAPWDKLPAVQMWITRQTAGLFTLNHRAVSYNQQHHNRPQAGWTRRFAPRLCAGRYNLQVGIE
jgi:hypothetical protein